MNIGHPLHSLSIKNIFYDKMDLRLFYFDEAISRVVRGRIETKVSVTLGYSSQLVI